MHSFGYTVYIYSTIHCTVSRSSIVYTNIIHSSTSYFPQFSIKLFCYFDIGMCSVQCNQWTHRHRHTKMKLLKKKNINQYNHCIVKYSLHIYAIYRLLMIKMCSIYSFITITHDNWFQFNSIFSQKPKKKVAFTELKIIY